MLKRYITYTSTLDLTSYVQSNNLDWSDINLYVKTHQKKIYEFSRIGDTLKVHYCQKYLFVSKQACMLALRNVLNTQSRHKFGFRNETNDFLFFDSDRIFKHITNLLDKNDKYTFNLVIQELLLTVLRPEWEARIEENSYGFSSNVVVNQAIIKTYGILSENKMYEDCTVLVGSLNHWLEKLDLRLIVTKSNCNGYLKKQLSSIYSQSLFSSSFKLASKKFQSLDIIGFPCNSLSLLLVNILFYGLERCLCWKSKNFNNICVDNIKIIVCSNHFVVIFPFGDLQWISLMISAIKSFFNCLNLALKNSDLNVRSIREGFDFLGFNFRRYPNEEIWNNQRSKLIVKPTNNNIKKHLLSIRCCLYHKDRLNRWRANAQMNQYDIINQLNPLIKSFSNYYADLIPLHMLNTLDRTLNQIIYRYAIKKYKSNRSQKWDENWTTIINGKKFIAYKNDTKGGYTLLYLHNRKSISTVV